MALLCCTLFLFTLGAGSTQTFKYKTFEKEIASIDRTQEKPQKIEGHWLNEEAEKIAKNFDFLVNHELAVSKMQEIINSIGYLPKPSKEHNSVRELAADLLHKLLSYKTTVEDNARTIEKLYAAYKNKSHPLTLPNSCCYIDSSHLRRAAGYKCNVSTLQSCDLLPSSVPPHIFNPGRSLTPKMQAHKRRLPSLVWQYFISTSNIHNIFPAHNFRCEKSKCESLPDIKHRSVYVSTVAPTRKYVVIVLDHGVSMSSTYLNYAKTVAKFIIRSLSSNDRLAIIGLSSNIKQLRIQDNDECTPNRLIPVTNEAKAYFFNFIVNNIDKAEGQTLHDLGFKKAFQLLKNELTNTSEHYQGTSAMIAYISRGMLTMLTEAKQVLETIAKENAALGDRVLINTFCTTTSGKPVMYETTFMQAVAEQDFAKYDIKRSKINKLGKMYIINSTLDLTVKVGDMFDDLIRATPNRMQISKPSLDGDIKDLVISFSKPVFYKGVLLGVSGLDIQLSDLTEHVTYYYANHTSYAFLLDDKGYTLMHPLLPGPPSEMAQLRLADIRYFEQTVDFKSVREKILMLPDGSRKTKLRNSNVEVVYTWSRVGEFPYIVVVRSLVSGDVWQQLSPQPRPKSHINYHRLDLLPSRNMCYHFKQRATFDCGTLFLAANGFDSPNDHLTQHEVKRMVQGYNTFLNDNFNLIANPGLKRGIRNEVRLLWRIVDDWKNKFEKSSRKDYIVRRFISTPTGIHVTYPGAILPKDFNPTTKSWFIGAMQNPTKTILTKPYLDEHGAGYIVSMSRSVYEGKSTGNSATRPIAVVGADFTMAYFYKNLLAWMPLCEQFSVRCFLVDDRGYLIAHPHLVQPSLQGPKERLHITHKEPLVANDILNHDGFVRKKLCNRYSDRTIQRFYYVWVSRGGGVLMDLEFRDKTQPNAKIQKLNTSMNGVLTNLVHGEHCARYQLTPVPGTNLLLGVVNITCEKGTAFCPCSVVDRLCLNCGRMEQVECECPCECPLHLDLCTGGLVAGTSNPVCPVTPEEAKHVDELTVTQTTTDLPQCHQSRCGERKEKMACLGVLDCEWCEMDLLSKSLEKPFCGNQRLCFGGILGARSPYRDHVQPTGENINEKQENDSGVPIGPVAAALLCILLLAAVVVYCYCMHHRNSRRHLNMEDCDRHLTNEVDDLKPLDDPSNTNGGPHSNHLILHSFDTVNVISPYRMNPSYRRPAGGGESDHGYSTMTPHEDSEQASTVCMDPHLPRDRMRPNAATSDLDMETSSCDTSVVGAIKPFRERPHVCHCHQNEHDSSQDSSSKLVPPPCTKCRSPSPTAIIEEKNQLLADVTVHASLNHSPKTSKHAIQRTCLAEEPSPSKLITSIVPEMEPIVENTSAPIECQ